MSTDFVSLTEIAGDEVSAEQIERMWQRYRWAGDYCRLKDVLEVACGTGQGVAYLASIAKSLIAADNSDAILAIARRHYADRFRFQRFNAQQTPLPDNSVDVVIIFEALYYLPDPRAFFAECRRVLRRGGLLLIATANKDLFDFNPSPHSVRYLGVVELGEELKEYGFSCEFFGAAPIGEVSVRQKLLRPIKMIAARLGVIPKSMAGKKLLKRLVFGQLIRMPAELVPDAYRYVPPQPVPAGKADRAHKVLLCAARSTA
jgi:ubiquinone/menaquinone biosynthesis C-methylase UbiE